MNNIGIEYKAGWTSYLSASDIIEVYYNEIEQRLSIKYIDGEIVDYVDVINIKID